MRQFRLRQERKFAVERLATESQNKLMPRKTVLFKETEISPTTIMVDEDRLRNTVSINRATLVQPENFAERQLDFTLDASVD